MVSLSPARSAGRTSGATEPADADLVESALSGSSDAFGALVSRYRALIFNFALRYMRDREEADDLAQIVFMRAFAHLRSYRPDRPFVRWIVTIARNAALDALKRRRRAEFVEPLAPLSLQGPEDAVVQLDETRRVRSALDALPDRFRAAIRLRYFDGLNYRESAEALGVPIGTVKTFISRGKRRMRATLSAEMQYKRSA